MHMVDLIGSYILLGKWPARCAGLGTKNMFILSAIMVCILVIHNKSFT